MRQPFWGIFTLSIIMTGLAACTVAAEPAEPGCTSRGIQIVPTATRERDPDLFSPPAPPADAGDGPCLPLVGPEQPADEFLEQFVTTEVVNLSLDITDQELAATAVGKEMLAVAWLTDGEIVVALSRGGNHFQVRPVDSGSSVSLAFSRANRLHMAYEQDGRILYRAADEGLHPADVDPFIVDSVTHPISNGRFPQVVVDEMNWAHVVYEQDGSIYKAKHLANEMWLTQFVAYGTNPTVRPFYNERELILWGVPTGTNWFGIIMAAPYDGQVRLFRYLSWFNVWEQVASFPIPSDETLLGGIGLDFRAVSEDEAWVYAAWVTKRPFPHPATPLYSQPLYEAANPLFPYQIANPHQIYEGLNAARWRSELPFDGGLRQTLAVNNPGEAITVSGWGLVEQAGVLLRLGLDPTGSLDPAADSVVWSDLMAAPSDFTQFTVSAAPVGGYATVFLHATHNDYQPGQAVWDGIAAYNGTLTNGGFEEGFSGPAGLVVPHGWTPYYSDSGAIPPYIRDNYTVYAAWSEDGGRTWTGPDVVAANRDGSGAVTGAIAPDVYPVISLATEPPSINFFYIYESGDPPPNTDFLRFGRPHQSQCPLGTTDCTMPPGQPLLHPGAARPSSRLLAAADPQQPGRAVLAWDGLQSDNERRDVYATYAVMR